MNSPLAENFNKYFEVVFADTPELRKACFRIRHQVYSTELGWEPRFESQMESDGYDDFSYSFLLRHKRTRSFLGTIRLVLPPPEYPDLTLPFEDHCLDSLLHDAVDLRRYGRGTYGEASRLAVLGDFRKRIGETGRPYVVDDGYGKCEYTEEEKRSFSIIAIGLYLSVLAFAKMHNHEFVFALIEPRLQKRLMKVGLTFERAGADIEYRGTRALFFLRRQNYISKLNKDMLDLFYILESQLAEQMALQPYMLKAG